MRTWIALAVIAVGAFALSAVLPDRESVRYGLAVVLGAELAYLGWVAPRRSILVIFGWLVVLGTARRLESWWNVDLGRDPLLLVGPAGLATLTVQSWRAGAFKWWTVLSALVAALSVIAVLEVFNPRQGSVGAGAVGLVFWLVPMLWFWVGRAFADERVMHATFGLFAVAGVLTSVYGLAQALAGFPPWDDQWIRDHGYSAVFIGDPFRGGSRPFRVPVVVGRVQLDGRARFVSPRALPRCGWTPPQSPHDVGAGGQRRHLRRGARQLRLPDGDRHAVRGVPRVRRHSVAAAPARHPRLGRGDPGELRRTLARERRVVEWRRHGRVDATSRRRTQESVRRWRLDAARPSRHRLAGVRARMERATRDGHRHHLLPQRALRPFRPRHRIRRLQRRHCLRHRRNRADGRGLALGARRSCRASAWRRPDLLHLAVFGLLIISFRFWWNGAHYALAPLLWFALGWVDAAGPRPRGRSRARVASYVSARS